MTLDKPFADLTPLYLAVFLNTVCSTARDVDKLKKLKVKAEDKFTRLVFQNCQHFSKLQIARIVDFLGAYISQSAGRDLSQAEPFLIKLTQGALSLLQKQLLKDVFAVVCRYVFVKKAKDQLDQ